MPVGANRAPAAFLKAATMVMGITQYKSFVSVNFWELYICPKSNCTNDNELFV